MCRLGSMDFIEKARGRVIGNRIDAALGSQAFRNLVRLTRAISSNAPPAWSR